MALKNEAATGEKERAVFAAVLALAQQGADLSALRVQQIARQAGMGKGTLYEYFPSKEEILQGTLRYCVQSELERMARTAEEGQGFFGRLEAGLDYVDELVAERWSAYCMVAQVLQREGLLCPKESDPLAQAVARIEGLLAQTYALAKAKGALGAAVEQEYFCTVIISAMVGYASTLACLTAHGAPDQTRRAQLRAHTSEMMRKALA